MSNKEAKKLARKLYSTKEYNLALRTILKINSTESEAFLIKESIKNQWFQDFNFCNCIAKDDCLIKNILNLSRIEELLYKHFICDWQTANTLNPISFQQKILEKSPKIFIRMIRVSQAFLKNKWYSEISCNINSEYFNNHSLIWKFLYKNEKTIWNKLLDKFDSCMKEYDYSILLTNISIIIEHEYLKEVPIVFLRQIYNTFINILLSKLPKNYPFTKELKIDLENIITNRKVNDKIKSLYVCISNWIDFINTNVDPYCFDLKIETTNESGIISYCNSSIDYYKWILDGIRYEINLTNYFHFNTPPYDSNKNVSDGYNFMCERNCKALYSFLEDLKLQYFPGKSNLNSLRFYQPLISASNYYKYIYEQFYYQSKNWFLAYKKLNKNNPNHYSVNNFPFIHSTVNEFYDYYDGQSKLENDFKTKQDTLSEPYTYKAITGRKYNRFNNCYDVVKKPFLKLGDKIFTPTLFFSQQDWFYSTAQNALEKLNIDKKFRKETSNKMELDLKLLFEKAGFETEIYCGDEFTSSEGDVDIKATDGVDTILIQLKRTKLRLNLKDAYFEYIQTDTKASRQINNVQKYFKSENGKIHKWIVSTSFENVYTTINNCLKVNYFDLIQILKSFNNITIDDLNNLVNSDFQIRYVLMNKNILHPENLDIFRFIDLCNNESIKKIQQHSDKLISYDNINLPLPLSDPSKYRIAKIPTNEFSNLSINTYKKALDFHKCKQYKKAIILLERCLYKYPNDFEYLSSIANVLADMKNYNKAIFYFEKALKIQPDDLFVCRNYIITLLESGKKEQASIIIDKVDKYYWFVDTPFYPKVKNMSKESISKILEKYKEI